MYAAKLTMQITLLRPAAKDDALAGVGCAWEDAGSARAERVSWSGQMRAESGERWSETRLTLRLRAGHKVRAGWRLRADGELYEVCAAEENRRRGMLTLICEAVNE